MDQDATTNQEEEANDSYSAVRGIPAQDTSTLVLLLPSACLLAEFHCAARQAGSITSLLSSIASSETQQNLHTDEAAVALMGLVRHPLPTIIPLMHACALQANSIVLDARASGNSCIRGKGGLFIKNVRKPRSAVAMAQVALNS